MHLSPYLLEAEDLSKKYISEGRHIRALQGVTFQVEAGETVGIVGRNGSGKSTLLKILAQVAKPDSGTAVIRAPSTSILDISGYLIPELTGEENVRLWLNVFAKNGKEHDAVLKEITDYSELGDAINQPVKTYSNGMMLRLAFGLVFSGIEEILLLDEVLTVGDESFRLKCYDRLRQMQSEGKTILLASHSKTELLELCSRCIWLDKGRIIQDGPARQVLEEYFESQLEVYSKTAKHAVPLLQPDANNVLTLQWQNAHKPSNDLVALDRIEISNPIHEGLDTLHPINVVLSVEKKASDITLDLCLIITDTFMQPMMAIMSLNNTRHENFIAIQKQRSGLMQFKCTIPPGLLASGTYGISLQFGKNARQGVEFTQEAFRAENICRFKIQQPPGIFDYTGNTMPLYIRPVCDWQVDFIS